MQLELRQMYSSLQIKERKTHLLFVFELNNLQKNLSFCYNKKTQSLLRLLGGLRAINGYENVTYYFQAFIR